MNTRNYIRTGIFVSLVFLLTACNSWLDVKPEDRIIEKELFKDRAGFVSALNGVYAELNQPVIYGQNLTAGMIDVMAQYYNCVVGSPSSHRYQMFMDYVYAGETYKTKFDQIWSKMYGLIANCNALIEQCGEGTPLLPDNYYRIIKGEATALRAMLHFDLLRMFGPVWTETEKEKPAIPYMTKADRTVQPLLSAVSVLELVIADLKEASELLYTVDPVLTQGRVNVESPTGNNDMNYRQYRLNYLAVQALMARAYLWGENIAAAGEAAREVIRLANDPENPLFPLVTPDYMASRNDRVFSPEVLFALYNSSLTEQLYKSLFESTLPSTVILAPAGDFASGRVSLMYDDKNDYRYKMWDQAVVSGQEQVYLMKYRGNLGENEDGSAYRYMLPMIRLSEMYLIAAECEPDIRKALDDYFNPLRFHRFCVDQNASSSEELQRLIKEEYTREFIGEGQLFFYFKRHRLLTLPDGANAGKVKSVTLDNYVFPLPESEVSQRAESEEE